MTEEQGQCVPSFQLQRSITTGRLRRKELPPRSEHATRHLSSNPPALSPTHSLFPFFLRHVPTLSSGMLKHYKKSNLSFPPTHPPSLTPLISLSLSPHISHHPHLISFHFQTSSFSLLLLKNSFPRRVLSLCLSLYLSTLSHPRSLLDRI